MSSEADTTLMVTDSLYCDNTECEKVCPRTWPAEAQYQGRPWIQNLSSPWQPTHGLCGHHLCINSSHGRYYDQKKGWAWQRPFLFCTTEDLLTPSFVYPFLMPMLENAGAVVWTPRERDMQPHLVLADSITHETSKAYCWQLQAPEAGEYAVYVRYPNLPNAVPDATYTIHHAGERTRIAVNQRMGADVWVYMGSYYFNPAHPHDGRIELSKHSAYRGRLAVGGVRMGAGHGITGQLRYLEAARYYAQWMGLPDSVWNPNEDKDHYKDDIRTRPNAMNYVRYERGVPFELALAVHTDAGYRPDSIPYGTLTICTTVDGNGRHNYDNIISRMASYDLADELLQQVSSDLATRYRWHPREIYDRNYGETRVPSVPSSIIEMLSHQNFLDMRLAHDPVFKFRMCRAIYKGLLRYTYKVNNLTSPIIQPLPIHNFKALMEGEDALLSWQPTPDPQEPSAFPTHYIIYTRMDDGDFDNGQLTTSTTFRQHLRSGHIYTFRIVAANDGGMSFPSHQLSVYRAHSQKAPTRLLVDAFSRLSGPAYVWKRDSIGFLLDEDPGVPYRQSLEYCGKQVCFNPARAGKEGPGALGYCSNELTGIPLQGNYFDICAQRAQTLVQENPDAHIISICAEGIESTTIAPATSIYWLAGKQRRAPHNMDDYPVWPTNARSTIEKHLQQGGTLWVEGEYVAPALLSSEERTWWDTLSPSENIHLPQ